ncbi:hypothetical protein POVWA1_064750 [Plasmodium ovale wallikeri]|uniref:Uncharacterized protein n=1 Tax=Plasmodium ovale wallikeri TaxID=864142 RepID=A0A1A9ABN6_PLAOA|nr:hypothetical protein POVWA1_064750 [Plasmodium ovale wallikeri]
MQVTNRSLLSAEEGLEYVMYYGSHFPSSFMPLSAISSPLLLFRLCKCSTKTLPPFLTSLNSLPRGSDFGPHDYLSN